MASTATVSATSVALTATTTNKTTTAGVTEDLDPAAPRAAKGRSIIAEKRQLTHFVIISTIIAKWFCHWRKKGKIQNFLTNFLGGFLSGKKKKPQS